MLLLSIAINRVGLVTWAIFSGVLYYLLGYEIDRTQTSLLLGIWGLLFLSYFYILYSSNKKDISTIILITLAFRAILLFSVPNLSDDYFRFIWDGKLIAEGINPYLYTPTEIINSNILSDLSSYRSLYTQLNSPNYYSVYPPVMQAIFWIATKLSLGNFNTAIVIMKAFQLLAEIGTIIAATRLLKKWSFENKNILLYAANPLIIIELCGNLHFEGVMIAFLILSLLQLTNKKFILSTLFLSLSISTKLIPLLFLPFLFRYLGLRKGITYVLTTVVITILIFWPFIDLILIAHIFNSVELYFQHFEFNASIYYITRSIGYAIKGYNIISVAGVLLPFFFIITTIILFFSQRAKERDTLLHRMFWILTIYFIFALVVHPWYISTLLILSIFTQYRFPVMWTLLIGGTYITYHYTPYQENLLVVSIEYFLVFGLMTYELIKHRNSKSIRSAHS